MAKKSDKHSLLKLKARVYDKSVKMKELQDKANVLNKEIIQLNAEIEATESNEGK